MDLDSYDEKVWKFYCEISNKIFMGVVEYLFSKERMNKCKSLS